MDYFEGIETLEFLRAATGSPGCGIASYLANRQESEKAPTFCQSRFPVVPRITMTRCHLFGYGTIVAGTGHARQNVHFIGSRKFHEFLDNLSTLVPRKLDRGRKFIGTYATVSEFTTKVSQAPSAPRKNGAMFVVVVVERTRRTRSAVGYERSITLRL